MTRIRYSDAERIEVTLPDLEQRQATLVAWMKRAGDAVACEEPLCLIAVGGVHAEVGSPAGGVIAEIVIPAGTAIDAGAVLAELAVVDAEPKGAEPDLASFRSPAVRLLAAKLDVDLGEVSGTGRGGRVTREDVLAHAGKPVAH